MTVERVHYFYRPARRCSNQCATKIEAFELLKQLDLFLQLVQLPEVDCFDKLIILKAVSGFISLFSGLS